MDDLPRPFRLDLNASFQPAALAVERSARAIELAVEHGWADEPVVAVPTRPRCVRRIWQVGDALTQRPLRWVTIMGYFLSPRVDRFVDPRQIIPARRAPSVR